MNIKNELSRRFLAKIHKAISIKNQDNWLGRFQIKYDHRGYWIEKILHQQTLKSEQIEDIQDLADEIGADNYEIMNEEELYHKIRFFFKDPAEDQEKEPHERDGDKDEDLSLEDKKEILDKGKLLDPSKEED